MKQKEEPEEKEEKGAILSGRYLGIMFLFFFFFLSICPNSLLPLSLLFHIGPFFDMFPLFLCFLSSFSFSCPLALSSRQFLPSFSLSHVSDGSTLSLRSTPFRCYLFWCRLFSLQYFSYVHLLSSLSNLHFFLFFVVLITFFLLFPLFLLFFLLSR